MPVPGVPVAVHIVPVAPVAPAHVRTELCLLPLARTLRVFLHPLLVLLLLLLLHLLLLLLRDAVLLRTMNITPIAHKCIRTYVRTYAPEPYARVPNDKAHVRTCILI